MIAGIIAIEEYYEFTQVIFHCANEGYDMTDMEVLGFNLIFVFNETHFDELCEELMNGNLVNGAYVIFYRMW